MVNHEGNKTDKKEGGRRAETEREGERERGSGGRFFSDLKCI